MEFNKIFSMAVNINNLWPLILLSFLAYPIYSYILRSIKPITLIILSAIEKIHAILAYGINNYIKRITDGDIASSKEAIKIEIKLKKVKIKTSKIIEYLEGLKITLSSELIALEISGLRDIEIQLQAYRYAAILINPDSKNLDNAAVNFITYMERLKKSKTITTKYLTYKYFMKLMKFNYNLDHDLIRYNTLYAIKEMLSNEEIKQMVNQIEYTDLSDGAQKLISSLCIQEQICTS